MGKSKKKSRRNIATSDPDKSKGNSSLFRTIMKNTREAGKHILLKYEDGYYQVRPPVEQNDEYLVQRHSYSDELIGKTEFEKGMHVRAKYNGTFRISKAIVVEVDADVKKIDSLFDTLDDIRLSEGKRKNAPPKRSERMINADRLESDRNKRNKLNDRMLGRGAANGPSRAQSEKGENEDSDGDFAPGPVRKRADGRLNIAIHSSAKRKRRSGSKSNSRSSRSSSASFADHKSREKAPDENGENHTTSDLERANSVNEEEFSENDWTRGEEARTQVSNTSDSETGTDDMGRRNQRRATGGESTSNFSHALSLPTTSGLSMDIIDTHEKDHSLVTDQPAATGMTEEEKCKMFRSFHLKKAKEYEQKLKELGAVKERKPKLKVPEIKWSFLKDASKVDRTIYQRLDRSDIWVKQKNLQELQSKAKDMDEYARKLMWKILVPADEVIDLSQRKIRGVGFVKMFGKKNLESFFEHVHKFAAQKKASTGAKWANVPTTETQFKAKFTAALENRLKSINKNSVLGNVDDAF